MAEEEENNIDLYTLWDKIKGNILLIVILVAGGITAYAGFFTVNPEEVGVITRLGVYNKTVEPGLNFMIPFIDRVYKVPVERQQKLEFGFRTTKADVRSEYEERTDESLMLTGDLNLADVEWVVQYRVSDPVNYLFKVRQAEKTLGDISEAAMRQIVGDRTVNEVLTIGRAEISGKMKELTQRLSDEYSLGIKVDQVVLQDVNPPEPVKEAFNAVNEAQQQKETLINQAKSEYNKVIPRARGQAEETIQKAEGYATERVNNAQGDVARFVELFKEYQKAPGVTKTRIHLETLGRILPELGNKVITDQDGSNVLPLLNMDMKNLKTN